MTRANSSVFTTSSNASDDRRCCQTNERRPYPTPTRIADVLTVARRRTPVVSMNRTAYPPKTKTPAATAAALEQRFVGGLRFARTEKNVNPSAMSRGIDQYFSISGIPRRVRPPKESPPQSVNNPTSRASAKPKYMMMRCPTLPPPSRTL